MSLKPNRLKYSKMITLQQKATYFITLGFLTFGFHLSAQTDSIAISEEVVQVSGLVVTGDSLMPMPFATVFRARDSRGTMTDVRGFFSIPVLAGDTLRFSSTGFITREAIISTGGEKNRISLVQTMGRDTVMMNEAFIYPWPSREAFKREFMALCLEQSAYDIAQQAIDPFDIYDRLIDVGLDGQAASSAALRQMSIDYGTAGAMPTTNLLNPVAWAQFLQALKNGDLEKH